MDRVIKPVLRSALLVAAIGSLLSLVRMIVAAFYPVGYYWWGAVAFVAATLVLGVAVHVHDMTDRRAGPRLASPDSSASA